MLKAHSVFISQKDVYKHKIVNAGAYHKLIYSLFECHRTEEELKASKSSEICWVELDESPFGKKFLVISEREIHEVPCVKISSKDIPDQLFDFEKYKFNIVVNPAYRERVEEGKRIKGAKGKLVVLNKPDDVQAWFIKKAPLYGFEVQDLEVQSMSQKQIGGGKPNLQAAKLRGVLVVKDKERFKEVFKLGVGRGRAYGFGLLQITPLKF